jgi:hypothetical protein
MTKQGRPQTLRYTAYVAGLFLLGGPALSACDSFDSPDAQYGGVCVDQVTQQRVDDNDCGDWDDSGVYSGGPGYHGYSHGTYMMWYPVTYGGSVPSIGQRATGGTKTVPSGSAVAKGIPQAGAAANSGGMKSITRGGFGAKSGTSGGTGAKAASSGGSGGKSGGS